MNWDAIGAVGQLFGSVAVLISIATSCFRCAMHRKPLVNRCNTVARI
jgi:hypothetical protein